jgi:DNA-binding NarL/FixJ family response regulator
VDDHTDFRAHARWLLEFEGNRVVGHCGERFGTRGRARAPAGAPLVDVHLADANGFELTAWLGALPGPPGGGLTSSRDRAGLEPSVSELGARGLVPKSEPSRDATEDLLR